MRKFVVFAVLVGALTWGVLSAAAAGVTERSATDIESRHQIKLNKALNFAFEVAADECASPAQSGCFFYQAGPGCRKVTKHRAECPIHLVKGTPGDPATQQDCHNTLVMKIKKGIPGVFYGFPNAWICVPNTEHAVR